MKNLLLVCAVSVISLFIATTAQANAFLALADIHFDPFLGCDNAKPCKLITTLQAAPITTWAAIFEQYDKSTPRYFADTNYQLLNAALHQASELAQQHQAQFVIILGDELGHNYRSHYMHYTGDNSRADYEAFTRKTLQFLTYSFNKILPKTITIYSVLGNNDTYYNDYVTRPQSIFLEDVSNIWSNRIKNNAAVQQSIRQQMRAYGYYAVNISPSLLLITLNTNLFSNKVRTKRQAEAAVVQLHWLHQMLQQAQAKHANVYLAMHIPASIDVYAGLNIKLLTLDTLWQTAFAKQYEQEIEQHAAIIRGIFTGHLHTDWLHIKQYGNKYAIPLIGVPAISPFFGTTPAMKVIFYTPGSYQVLANSPSIKVRLKIGV